MTRLRIGALFAGYGGLDLAVESVFGATAAWVSEFDAAPSRILAQRFPDAPNHGDVTKIDWSQVEPADIITGGSPCQDLSHAGKRAGMKAGHLERYGPYADGIARWEAVLGREAPAPTEPTGKGGAHRLSPRFVEWMMGLPDGWVTNVGLSRNEQLKALGNGVVPQQAEAALRHMLTTCEAMNGT